MENQFAEGKPTGTDGRQLAAVPPTTSLIASVVAGVTGTTWQSTALITVSVA